MDYQYSIVLPCYNPIVNWQEIVLQNIAAVKAAYSDMRFQLIIVNDGSTTNLTDAFNYLSEKIEDLEIISYHSNCGKGYALRKGVERASGAYILFTDIDFPYTMDSFFSIMQELAQGGEVVIGIKDSSYYDQIPLGRKLVSKTLRAMIRTMLRMHITDTQCDLEFIYNLEQEKKFHLIAKEIKLRDNIQLTKTSLTLLVPELINFVKIVAKRWL
jgi:glycosyltransferase involved in cell wall biosynthesis